MSSSGAVNALTFSWYRYIDYCLLLGICPLFMSSLPAKTLFLTLQGEKRVWYSLVQHFYNISCKWNTVLCSFPKQLTPSSKPHLISITRKVLFPTNRVE